MIPPIKYSKTPHAHEHRFNITSYMVIYTCCMLILKIIGNSVPFWVVFLPWIAIGVAGLFFVMVAVNKKK